ncbi:type II toxin-antitoxin system HipA family toxin [soil metagenome]
MSRRLHSRTLGLWANGERIGRWTRLANGETELQYDPVWIASGTGRPLSLSLPVPNCNAPLTGPRVTHWFDNLLPDGETLRQRIAERFVTPSADAFDLLSVVGRDCVGAVQLLSDDSVPTGVDRVDGTRVDEADIERHLIEIDREPEFGAGGNPDHFRVALPGDQSKAAFLWQDGQWHKPRDSTPTTHIFKRPMGFVGRRLADFSTSVDNEWLCLKLLDAYGLEVVPADICTFGEQRVLVMERSDRMPTRDGRRVVRRMQEDFCQATGTAPWQKYEKQGGPGLIELFRLTRQSVDRDHDLRALMASQILFWMLRVPNGHAKHFGLQLMSGASARFRLTPFQDVVSALPAIGTGAGEWAWQDVKLAMALTGKHPHFSMHGIQRRHFNTTARKVGYGANAEPLLRELIEKTPAAVARVQAKLPPGFSQRVADRIFNGLLDSARALEAMPAD